MKRTIYMAWMLLGLYACQSDEPMPDGAADRRVYLAATVENAQVQSRVPYMLTAPSLSNPLKVDVWASTDKTEFKDENKNGSDGTGDVAYHTTARFTNGTEQLLNDVIYPKEGGNAVYFVGMHPMSDSQNGSWTTTDGTSAIFTFDGNDDVMFAPHIFGVYGGNTTGDKWPTLKFCHLLTWLRIEMVADNETVREAWGKVTDITIASQNQVTVDLSKEYDAATSVTFSDTGTDFSFYQTDTDTKFPANEGYELKTTAEEVAYVLCSPVNATATDTETTDKTTEYTIKVKTEKREVEIGVDLMKAASEHFTQTTMGHQFSLLLRFKMGDNISVSAVATDWVNGGMGTGDIGENDIKEEDNDTEES